MDTICGAGSRPAQSAEAAEDGSGSLLTQAASRQPLCQDPRVPIGRPAHHDLRVAYAERKERRQPRLAQQVVAPSGRAQPQGRRVCRPYHARPATRAPDCGEVDAVAGEDGGGDGSKAIEGPGVEMPA